ncbi:nuclear transport factor 2 family protein [Streptomyces sp. LX-29]|uniref:nuclear transport factor 2 family protein n=1 Tax=Streptomyces sp. LX-29 TaxID=2900152 RepID=UPI00240D5856|nr:nuclear transport factor 2 family protein [Streptomyces sp. LX-29]WFB07457.1 nuclear transport factor 2 family protein [Streptomyces sp. LX-29]
MASPNIEAIQRSYAGFRAGDPDGLLSAMHPDVEWVHPDGLEKYGLGGTKLGHDGVRAFLARVPAVLGGMRLEPREFIEQGDRVVVFGTRQVTSLSGRTATLDFVHSWTMRDGKATRVEDIFDTVVFNELLDS